MLEGPAQQQLDEETAKQDAILDQVGNIVGELKDQANQINQALVAQDDDINDIASGLDDTNADVKELRKKVARANR